MRGLLLAAMVEAGLITYRDVSKQKVLPLPSDYVAVAIFFGGLSLLPESASGFASLVGWGVVLATWLKLPFSSLIYPGNAQVNPSKAVPLAPLAGGPNEGFNNIRTPVAPGTPNQPGQIGFGAAVTPVNQQTGVAQ